MKKWAATVSLGGEEKENHIKGGSLLKYYEKEKTITLLHLLCSW
jgi:hypothetical protein